MIDSAANASLQDKDGNGRYLIPQSAIVGESGGLSNIRLILSTII
jgi:hypothetical protein